MVEREGHSSGVGRGFAGENRAIVYTPRTLGSGMLPAPSRLAPGMTRESNFYGSLVGGGRVLGPGTSDDEVRTRPFHCQEKN